MMTELTLQHDVIVVSNETRKCLPAGTTEVFKILKGYELEGIDHPWQVSLYFDCKAWSLSLSEFCAATDLNEEELKTQVEAWYNSSAGKYEFEEWIDFMCKCDPNFLDEEMPNSPRGQKEIPSDGRN